MSIASTDSVVIICLILWCELTGFWKDIVFVYNLKIRRNLKCRYALFCGWFLQIVKKTNKNNKMVEKSKKLGLP